MAKDCPSCNPVTNQKRTRWLVFTDTLTDGDTRWATSDVVITRNCYPRRRFGHAQVCCACDAYGHQRLGAGAVVVWGKNTTKLFEAFKATLDPTVFVALVAGTTTSGKAVAKIQKACAEADRLCFVVEFSSKRSCHVDPTMEPKVVFANVGLTPQR